MTNRRELGEMSALASSSQKLKSTLMQPCRKGVRPKSSCPRNKPSTTAPKGALCGGPRRFVSSSGIARVTKLTSQTRRLNHPHSGGSTSLPDSRPPFKICFHCERRGPAGRGTHRPDRLIAPRFEACREAARSAPACRRRASQSHGRLLAASVAAF